MEQDRYGKCTQRFIEKIEILIEQGIDVTKMSQRDTIKTLARKSRVVITKEQAEKLGIELIDRIGNAKMNIASAYRGSGSCKKPTQEQVQKLLKLGINLEPLEKRNIIQEFIEKIEILKEQGINVLKINKTDTIETLFQKSGLELTEENAKKLGIKLSDKIGYTKMNITSAYRGKGTYKKPTQEQVKRLLELGISLEKVRRTGKEIAKTSIGSIKHMEISDKADKELQELVKEVQKEK